jgi:hypothetical protein
VVDIRICVLLGPQANQARLLATAEVARLLASVDDLKRLPALREDVLAKQQVGLIAPCTLTRSGAVWHWGTGDAAKQPLLQLPTPQANRAQLSAAVSSQVEATKSGLDMLTRAHQVRSDAAAGAMGYRCVQVSCLAAWRAQSAARAPALSRRRWC